MVAKGIAMEPVDKALMVAAGMEKRRAMDVMVLDMRDLMVITDFFVICHGRSVVHVDAIAESVQDHMEENGMRAYHKEGGKRATWTILDYGTVIAHVFTEESREFYDLERLWEDAGVVEHVSEAGDEVGVEAEDMADLEALDEDELDDDELDEDDIDDDDIDEDDLDDIDEDELDDLDDDDLDEIDDEDLDDEDLDDEELEEDELDEEADDPEKA